MIALMLRLSNLFFKMLSATRRQTQRQTNVNGRYYKLYLHRSNLSLRDTRGPSPPMTPLPYESTYFYLMYSPKGVFLVFFVCYPDVYLCDLGIPCMREQPIVHETKEKRRKLVVLFTHCCVPLCSFYSCMLKITYA